MKPFITDNFMLQSSVAIEIYEHIKKLPIIDYHCHLDPAAIANNNRFRSITELWLGGDHYKWRLMRHNGIPETHITGNAPDFEKFEAFCETIERAIGNPVHHWAHLELRAYFGYDKPITKADAADIFKLCNSVIDAPDFNVHSLLKGSNVEWLATTDDPVDSLEHHVCIKGQPGVPGVMPSFRPSNAMDIEKQGFTPYIARLGEVAGVTITCWESLCAALVARVDHFHSVGCRISDHSLEPPVFSSISTVECANNSIKKALAGETLTHDDIIAYKTQIMLFLGNEYAKRNWVMQIHMGAQRSNNTRMFNLVGADTGFDSMSDDGFSLAINRILDGLEKNDALPRTVLYALNPNADDMLATTIGNFAGRGIKGRMQWGSAWWFNDNKTGMLKHMVTLANHGMLANFIGMLTDSRSFISYPRHEYFRRILANQLGKWVTDGEFPCDMKLLCNIAADIAYNNVKAYF